ncbi:MAG: flavodoxin family protein [Coriobacteriia bacterium]
MTADSRDIKGDAPYLLAVAGSPRRHGNSDSVLDAFLEGAKTGVRVQRIVPAEMDLSPCRGCNACSLTGECVIHDDMQRVYGLIDGASGIVIASPVFFATVPAVLKILIDRLQPYWAKRYVLKEPPPARRPGSLLFVRGGGDPFGFQAAVYACKSAFAVLNIECLDVFKLAGVDSPGDLGKFPEAHEDAERMGRQLAEAIAGGADG